VPHAPQLFGSLASERQKPPQSEVLSGHVQEPATQVVPWAHATPHLPQFAGSVLVSTHASPHAVCPVPGHAQAPPTQLCAPEHGVVQLPQCSLSVEVSTQSAPHATSPTAHEEPHVPLAQTSPASHAWLHDPQCASSFWRSTHALPQSVCPAVHGDGVSLQTPLTHVEPAGQSVSALHTMVTLLPQLAAASAARKRSATTPIATLAGRKRSRDAAPEREGRGARAPLVAKRKIMSAYLSQIDSKGERTDAASSAASSTPFRR
jgi:hypothetical protein